MKGRCFAQIRLIQQNAIASLNAFSGTSTVTLKMEITSHSLEVQCLGQGDLGPGSSTWCYLYHCTMWMVIMHSEMFFQAETGTHSSFKGESFYDCTSCLFSISLNSECRQKNVTNSQQRKSYMKKSKMLKRQWEKLRSSRLHFHSGDTEGSSPPQNATATSPSPLWTDHLQHHSAFAWPCVTELPWAFSRINSALLLNWFQRV